MRAALLMLAACYSPTARDWASTDANPDVALTVTIMGEGKVTIADVGACDSATAPHGMCTFTVPGGMTRQLQAAATNEDHPFSGWTQGCSGKSTSCSLVVMSPTQVGARFQ